MRWLQNEHVFHFPLSPTPGRWFWTCTLLTLALKKSRLARTVDSRLKPSTDGSGCGEQAQIPSAGITEEQSWQGGDCKQSQVQRGTGQGMGRRGRVFFHLHIRQLSYIFAYKGGHCCLNPVTELVGSRRPHHWRWQTGLLFPPRCSRLSPVSPAQAPRIQDCGHIVRSMEDKVKKITVVLQLWEGFWSFQ